MNRPEGIVIVITEDDTPYVSRLFPALQGVAVRVLKKPITTLSELILPLQKAGIKHVISTRPDLLMKLVPAGVRRVAKIDNYAGSIIEHEGIEFLFIHPLKQLVTVPYGEFLASRYISKFVAPATWPSSSKLIWQTIKTEADYEEALSWLRHSDLIGVDIETVSKPKLAMTMVGYCGIDLASNTSKAFVLPIDSMEAVYKMRRLNTLDPPKVMQNGKYDAAWFFKYGAPLHGWYFDTANMLHAWYSELPKDLGSVSAFFVRNSMYWKDLASGNKEDQYKYNALDTWATVDSAVAWLQEAPDWAVQNYLHKFPMNFPSHMCEMRGIARDEAKLREVAQIEQEEQDAILAKLQRAAGTPKFNPSSPKQVLALLHILGHKGLKSSAEADLKEAMLKHPLTAYFAEAILEYRGRRKLSSTYLKTGSEASEYKGRILYSINPHGTDTGRNSSAAHHFWCGLQIQNIPAAGPVKSTLVADPGFELWEADYSQAEDRGVAYKSGDPELLRIFESGQDSHTVKASMFFGMPVEEVNAPVRKLGKRINHGANYNMGAAVLAQTMGTVALLEAKKLLNLPARMSVLDVAAYLLNLYELKFRVVKTDYYNSIKKEVRVSKKLVGDTGWVRYCFSDPYKSKRALNMYIAHVTQSLIAMLLDRAFLAAFKELGNNPDFKLLAQIHDSIFFQVRKGHDHLAHRVKELMTNTIPVRDCFGTLRNMTIPVDLKKLGNSWGGDDV
ncbi:DNA polymerase [Candidatus Macondimonas diazotrophica]|jgi:DNA polymerase I-like protein with 3'-5' exonuclease and polymerase domains|uniref:DNA polymerase I n=1 Tax=Candidatus Macondimonas diazotrophica TaxID=2305248 RepID=A0A4Z0F610_9GAMM|nr:DNA polymerase [Candidatus Macondimonas diazotrophica]TFZ81668.1 hypothetical protein E4680_11400 [Candidatus Macondimonas diazotrophica]